MAQIPMRRIKVLPVNTARERQVDLAGRTGDVAHCTLADAKQFCLFAHWQRIGSMNNHLALSNPNLVSARSKKSFYSVSCPIWARSGCRSSGLGG